MIPIAPLDFLGLCIFFTLSLWVVLWVLTHAIRNTWTGILNCWDYRDEIPFFVWLYMPVAFVENIWSALQCFLQPGLEIEIIRQRKKP